MKTEPQDLHALAERLRLHVQHLAGDIGERHIHRPQALEDAAAYITKQFRALGLDTSDQPFQALAQSVRNIEVELPGRTPAAEIVLLGAHYDTVPGCPGANDNGSGVAALLEIARILRAGGHGRTVRLVAFVNEEPPYFQTESMGSLVYARRARARGDRVVAMMSMETMGYYTERPGSQQYPAPLGLFYPSTGNFIGIVGNVRSRRLVTRMKRAFQERTTFPVEAAAAPASLPGVGWSDHWAFWQAGYPAIMLTDTAPYRYPYYHTALDTPDRLDYTALATVVDAVAHAARVLARQPPD